jgi:tetratricopeptide (TPR) repeat protein
MDLQDFEGQDMYFDLPMPEEVETLISEAAECYSTGGAEPKLLRAYVLAPRNLTLLVAMYRFYYYQHRWNDALYIADQAMLVSGEMLEMTTHWRLLTPAHLGTPAMRSMGLLRFYFLALKGAGYLCLRMEDREGAVERLQKVVELDPQDRLGANMLLNMAIYGSVDGRPNLRLAYVNEERMAS